MEKIFKPNITKDKDLLFASFHAREEANEWRNIADKILKKDFPNRQACTILILSSELYLKSLLMLLGINVMTKFKKNNGHNLYRLYEALPDEDLKKDISTHVKSHKLEIDTGVAKYMIETFEEFLTEISDGFINYRYEYEKYLEHLTINVPIEFIINLNYILNKICNDLDFQIIDENGRITDATKPEVICYYEDKELYSLHKKKFF